MAHPLQAVVQRLFTKGQQSCEQGILTAEEGVGPDSDACMAAQASAFWPWQRWAGGIYSLLAAADCRQLCHQFGLVEWRCMCTHSAAVDIAATMGGTSIRAQLLC